MGFPPPPPPPLSLEFPGFWGHLKSRSALAELRSATSCFETVFLSFLHTRVTGEQTCSLEERTIGLINLKKCTGEAVADSACLTGDTAALNGADDIELTLGAGNGKGADLR